MSTVSRRDYVYKVFERQCEIGLENLAKVYSVVGDRVAAVFVTGTDFGTQTGSFISPRTYRDLYMPFHKEVNNWMHPQHRLEIVHPLLRFGGSIDSGLHRSWFRHP